MKSPKPKAPRKPRHLLVSHVGLSATHDNSVMISVGISDDEIWPCEAREIAAWLLKFAAWAETKEK